MKSELDRQSMNIEVLHKQMEDSMITKEELIDDYVIGSSSIVSEFQNAQSSILDSLSQFKYPILIYTYPEKECITCVHEDLMQIRLFQQKVGKEKICIFSLFSENRNNIIRLNSELYFCNHKNISTLSNMRQRFFALINKNGNIEKVFIPQKNMPELLERYFYYIENILKPKQELNNDVSYIY